ncbi:MAG: T9SS type A sorting domain-containing protein [Bacteroidales bacterium]|nr:T9SS type A sorting domain-containing protein [Bacteroidales bacterium]
MSLFFFILVANLSFAQIQAPENKIFVSGQVLSIEHNAPMINQSVNIIGDSTYKLGLSYNNNVLTDSLGFFYDTVYTTLSKGSLIIETFDYKNDCYDTTLYCRFIWDNSNTFNINFRINDSTTVNSCYPDFRFDLDTVNNYKVSFFDNSPCTGIISWEWNFGDGNFSSLQNPEHIYTENRTYRAKLSIVSYDQLTGDYTSTSLTKLLKVGYRDYFNMGGQVFAGYWPIDKGIGYLYKKENDDIIPIDTVEFDQEGSFWFYQIIGGDYIVKTDLDLQSNYYNEYFPGYVGDEINWVNAEIIHFYQTSFDNDIHLDQTPGYSYGPGNIGGIVENYETGIGIENIELIILDENNNSLSYTHSNEEGSFYFNSLAFGAYQIFAEVAGIQSSPQEVIISAQNPNCTDLIIVVDFTNGGVYINELENNELIIVGEIYPNPIINNAKIIINLEKSSNIEYSILNHLGQVVYSNNKFLSSGKQTLNINVSDFQNGLYSLIITTESGRKIHRKFLRIK